MKKLYILVLVQWFASVPLVAQQAVDSVEVVPLAEVIVIGNKPQLHQKQTKPLATVEDYLRQSGKVEMIRRGSYAWEPVLNSMATERIVVTIDGMRIFGACTDKMDPITSYVEVSNLSEAKITSGQEGSCHGATIGGSIDLKRNRFDASKTGWRAAANAGFDSNANQRMLGAAVGYTDSIFYFDTDFMSRQADNYKAGNGREVAFSQFRKFNISATSGFVWQRNKRIEASVIYDKADDIGYPALPMDVSLAEALITSLQFDYHPASQLVNEWETKIYYNTITHRMDDTTRPNVAIHMDMPGWSSTSGFYSRAIKDIGKHRFTADLNSFYNQSRAEMTMYPNDPSEALMFMDTWPDVRTRYAGFSLSDDYQIGSHAQFKFSAAVANHFNRISSQSGWESLQIFYPDLVKDNSRMLKSASAKYIHTDNGFEGSIGLGYGERAPSVSEGYGFYLFNSFDRYDYVGNPQLGNERSHEANGSFGYKNQSFTVKVSGSWFHILDYIAAIPNDDLIPMTMGASGVKTVGALDHADIVHATLDATCRILPQLKAKSQLVYSAGKDHKGINLPFISPLRYNGALQYNTHRFSLELDLEGNAVQSQYSPTYGEKRTPAYAVAGLASGFRFVLGKCHYQFKGGVENLFDAHYTTFADWNNIPRKGRNFFLNAVFSYD